MIELDVGVLYGRLDPLMRLMQVLTLLGIAGTVAAIYNAWLAFQRRDGRWFVKLWSVAFAFAATFLCWFLIHFHTLNPSLNC